MKQLLIGNLLDAIQVMKQQGMTDKEIKAMPIYIGNDDELNGIHTAWYVNLVDVNKEEDEYFIEMINEDRHNIKLNGKAIIIS